VLDGGVCNETVMRDSTAMLPVIRGVACRIADGTQVAATSGVVEGATRSGGGGVRGSVRTVARVRLRRLDGSHHDRPMRAGNGAIRDRRCTLEKHATLEELRTWFAATHFKKCARPMCGGSGPVGRSP